MLEAIVLSAGLVFLAELGDKSQLLAMTLSTRYRARTVFAGTAAAILVMNLVSALVGDILGSLLPADVVRIGAGVLFLAFAVLILREALQPDDDSEPAAPRQGRAALITVFVAFVLAEFGDKTMLTAMALSTQHAWYWIWLGSSLGMIASVVLAIWVGKLLMAVIPVRIVHLVAAGLFTAVGILVLVT